MKPFRKSIARYFVSYKKDITLLLGVITFSIIMGIVVYGRVESEFIIKDDDATVRVKTLNTNPKQILDENGFELGHYDEFDIISKDDDTNLIKIKRAFPVTILDNEKEYIIYTTKNSVKYVIHNKFDDLTDEDKVLEAKLTDKVKSGMTLSLVRVERKNKTIKKEIDFDVEKRESLDLARGEKKVLQEGQKGLAEKTFEIVYKNGLENSRELIKENVLVPAVNKIVKYGAENNYRISSGDIIRAKKVMDMSATSYTASYACTGKTPDHPYFGITATGKQAREGYVAVDPNVIPLGTKLYVELKDGLPDYGFAEAQDTGGAVKGKIIDLYFDDYERVQRFGRRRARVYILE